MFPCKILKLSSAYPCCFPLRVSSGSTSRWLAHDTHSAPPSSATSTWYVGPYSAGSLLLERPTESGHIAYFIQTDIDMHTGPHMCTQLTKKYTVKKLKSIISHFSRLSLSVNLSHCCCEGHLSLASVAIVTQGNNCWNYSKSIYDKNISSTICSNTLLTLLHCARKFYMSGPANEVISVSLFWLVHAIVCHFYYMQYTETRL